MTTPNPMIAALQRLSGREMLINPETTDEFVADITRFATTTREEAAQHEIDSRAALCMTYGIDDRPEGDGRKAFVYQDGVAVIPVHGALINRFNSSWGFVTGYNFIRRQMNLILADEDVDTFVFDVNTPGGEASGCFELGREILLSRQIKPSLAMVDALMASGGVGVAGCASRIYAIPSARIGSIGVYRQHISVEGALKDAGVKVTFATAGEHKVDGNAYQDLPESVLREWTQDVNKTWDDFIDLVAEARDLTPDEVRATQARIYRADEALAKGLINAVKSTADAVPDFVAEMADDQPSNDEEDDMNDGKSKSEATSGVDYEKIGAMISTGIGTAMTTMFAAQNRATAIKEHGKAKGQVALAAKLTANDKLTADEAIEMIDAAASAAAPKPAGKTKGQGKRERVSAEPEGDDDEDEDADGEDDLGEDDEGDEDEAEQARSARRRDRVKGADNENHLESAMNRSKRERVGAGSGEDDPAGGGDKALAALLGDHAAHTGNDLRKKPAA